MTSEEAAHDLIDHWLPEAGISITARDGRLVLTPRAAVTAEIHAEVVSLKAQLLELLDDPFDQLTDADRRFMLGPRNWPAKRCPRCDRFMHARWCLEVVEPAPSIPFGKHRGKTLDQVPDDYLRWAIGNGVGGETFLAEATAWRSQRDNSRTPAGAIPSCPPRRPIPRSSTILFTTASRQSTADSLAAMQSFARSQTCYRARSPIWLPRSRRAATVIVPMP